MQIRLMKPIETVYAGCTFRSRLEARWAVFFDEAGIRWEYEPEGFELEGGRRYLPDFWLPESCAWFEVKGDTPTFEEQQNLIEFARSLTRVESRDEARSVDVLSTLQYLKVAVGDIPRPSNRSPFIADVQGEHSHRDAEPWTPGWIWRVLVINGQPHVAARWWCRCDYGHTWVGWGWCWRCQAENHDRDCYTAVDRVHPDLNRALLAARSARFEHDKREFW